MSVALVTAVTAGWLLRSGAVVHVPHGGVRNHAGLRPGGECRGLQDNPAPPFPALAALAALSQSR